MSDMRDIVRDELRHRGIRRPGHNVKLASMVHELFREHTHEALNALLEVVQGYEGVKPSDRVAAAKELLDRGYGKSVSKIDMQVNHSHQFSQEEIENMSEDDLYAAIDAINRITMIDVTPETENESVEHVPNDQPVKRRNRSKA
jgi:hypothetical protein